MTSEHHELTLTAFPYSHRRGEPEEILAPISLPTIEIEGRRPPDFPTAFRNQAGDSQTVISNSTPLTVF